MLCTNCSKLVLLKTKNRICKKCGLIIYNNLSIICDNCSKANLICSICLKTLLNKQKHRSCNSCGKS